VPAPANGYGVAVADVGETVGVVVGVGLAVGDAVGLGVGLAVGDALGVGLAVGDAVGDGVADGVGDDVAAGRDCTGGTRLGPVMWRPVIMSAIAAAATTLTAIAPPAETPAAKA
jgi:hypothetical protein